MARVTLNNETYNAATDGSEISGNTGTEQVNVFAGVTDLEVAGNIERVDLPGDIADFTFSSFGNSLTIYDGDGNVVAAVSSADGKQVVFEDGALDVAFDAGTGDLTLGGETVSDDADNPAAVTPAPAEIDATTTSDSPDAGTGGGGTGGGGTGSTSSLTDAVGEIVNGTAGADTFVAVVAGATPTLNVGDQVDGLGGTDTANVFIDGAAATLPAGSAISNVEIINLFATAGGNVLAAVDSDDFAGVEQLWQVEDVSGAAVSVAADVTAGFRDTDVAGADVVTAKNGVDAVSVALDGIGEGSTVAVGEATAGDVQTVTVTGSVADDGSVSGTASDDTSEFALDLSGLADVQELILSISTDGVITHTASGTPSVTDVDLSGSTGGITLDLTTVIGSETALENITGGSGADVLTVDTSTAAAAGTVDGGAGNDSLTVDLNAAAENLTVLGGAGNDTMVTGADLGNTNGVTLTLTGGAGEDTYDFSAGLFINIADETAFEDELIEITDFIPADDVLDMNTLTRDVLTNTELSNIAAEATLEDAIDAAGAVTNGTEVSFFNYDGDAYALHSAVGGDLANGDGLIKLTGVSDVDDLDSSALLIA